MKNNIEPVELVIDSIAFQGAAVARKDDMVYFVKGGVPGDLVRADIIRKKRRYYEAEIAEVLEPSEHRIEPKCKYFGVCGGCSWQNLSYSEQLRWKKTHVSDALERIGKLKVPELKDTMPSPLEFNYRNKMEFSFGASRWLTKDEIVVDTEIEQKDFALGLHIPGRFDKVLDIEECHICPEIFVLILNRLREKALEYGTSAYHSRRHTGYLRNVIFRNSLSSAELMVDLITNAIGDKSDEDFHNWFSHDLIKEFPGITTLIHTVNTTVSPVSTGDSTVLKGFGFIIEKVKDINFKISHTSFFQTNSHQLGRFLDIVRDYTQIKNNEIVWDLYCGTGFFTLTLAECAKEIYGFELVASAISDAKMNAELNGLTNVHFAVADLHSKLGMAQLLSLQKPDVIIIDPPRAGMHPDLVETVLNSQAKRIVYVSCNPATQARDCELLSAVYSIVSVQPLDMFPHTYHVESVALLEKKD
ncbi:MAG: 23S rRNA (uracil(1939)-C(5))-methyltransferase RlmD [Bacteroidota bacterium]